MLTSLVVLLVAASAHAAIPPLLDEAIKKWIADEDHWAYTQRVQYQNGLSGTRSNRVERFDPSQPDDKQWTLLFIDGKVPTEADVRKWKGQKEREVKNRKRPLSDFFDIENAKIADENAETIRYELPFKEGKYRRFPMDKLAASIVVNKKTRTLVSLDAGLKESFHMGLGLAKITDAALAIRFKTVDEKYAPQPESIHANGAGRIALLFTVGADADVVWSDFQRVTPYKTRFGVEIGELRALGF